MKLEIEKHEGGLRIRIESPGDREHSALEAERLLEAVRECGKTSSWACPSGECVNIATMHATAEQGAVVLVLTPRPGETFSEPAIQECLHYTLDQSLRS